MKFKVAAKPEFRHTITLRTPDGQQTDVEFTFKYVKPTALDDFLEKAKSKSDLRDVLGEIIVDWGDAFEDADGKPMAYSKDALDALLNEYYLGYDIFLGFVEGLRGAREKN